MTTRTEKDKAKQLQDKCQSVLNALLRDEDNKYCVDCDAKGPRWASWNLGVFLCIRCAGIHRNLGVHISKVKSVNLDSWTPEQVVSLQQMGNSRARAVYEANLPDNFRRPQNDSSLESFIRAKYEHKKYIAREWVPPTLPKVNWEKEIDEEIERQKNKKKNFRETNKKNSLTNVEVPQLPKPKNPSPKPGRAAVSINSSATNNSITTENKQNADLLGLQNGEDVFSGFLSAVPTESSPKPEKPKKESDPIKSEEESFFNQTAPSEKEKVKLTKDSILALYGTAPSVNNFNQFQNHTQQVPYQQGFPSQQNFPNLSTSGFPQQSFGVQNGIPQFQQNQMHQFSGSFQGQQFSQMQWPSMPQPQQQQQPPQQQNAMPFAPTQTNQFAFQNGPNPMTMQGNSIPQFGSANQFNTLNQFPQNSNFTSQNSIPNPFFGNQSTGLQQQFGNLSLNSTQSAAPAPSLTSNIWQ